MSVTKPMGKTGRASITKQGQTASGNFGDDPSTKGKGQKATRDLGIQRSK